MSPLFMSESLVAWKKLVFSVPPEVFSCRRFRSRSISYRRKGSVFSVASFWTSTTHFVDILNESAVFGSF
jgi:hypothetical protein